MSGKEFTNDSVQQFVVAELKSIIKKSDQGLDIPKLQNLVDIIQSKGCKSLQKRRERKNLHDGFTPDKKMKFDLSSDADIFTTKSLDTPFGIDITSLDSCHKDEENNLVNNAGANKVSQIKGSTNAISWIKAGPIEKSQMEARSDKVSQKGTRFEAKRNIYKDSQSKDSSLVNLITGLDFFIKCQVCGTLFSRPSCLRRHMKDHNQCNSAVNTEQTAANKTKKPVEGQNATTAAIIEEVTDKQIALLDEEISNLVRSLDATDCHDGLDFLSGEKLSVQSEDDNCQEDECHDVLMACESDALADSVKIHTLGNGIKKVKKIKKECRGENGETLEREDACFSSLMVYHCGKCKALFSSEKSLTVHMALHEQDSVAECAKCGKMFVTQLALKKHQEKMGHQDMTKLKTSSEMSNIDTSPAIENKGHFDQKVIEDALKSSCLNCPACRYRATRHDSLKRHMMCKGHVRFTVLPDGKLQTYFKRYNLKDQYKGYSMCADCHYIAINDGDMRKHRQKHDKKGRSVSFTLIDKSVPSTEMDIIDTSTAFDNEGHVDQEVIEAALTESRVKCPACPFVANRPDSLKRHMMRKRHIRFTILPNGKLQTYFKRYGFNRHYSRYSKCTDCYFIATNDAEMRHHRRRHDKKGKCVDKPASSTEISEPSASLSSPPPSPPSSPPPSQPPSTLDTSMVSTSQETAPPSLSSLSSPPPSSPPLPPPSNLDTSMAATSQDTALSSKSSSSPSSLPTPPQPSSLDITVAATSQTPPLSNYSISTAFALILDNDFLEAKLLSENYSCGICKIRMVDRNSFWKHMIVRRHVKYEVLPNGGVQTSFKSKKLNVYYSKFTKCEHCAFVAKSQTEMKIHLNRHISGRVLKYKDNDLPEDCEMPSGIGPDCKMGDGDGDIIEAALLSRSLVCPVCQKRVTRPDFLRRHVVQKGHVTYRVLPNFKVQTFFKDILLNQSCYSFSKCKDCEFVACTNSMRRNHHCRPVREFSPKTNEKKHNLVIKAQRHKLELGVEEKDEENETDDEVNETIEDGRKIVNEDEEMERITAISSKEDKIHIDSTKKLKTIYAEDKIEDKAVETNKDCRIKKNSTKKLKAQKKVNKAKINSCKTVKTRNKVNEITEKTFKTSLNPRVVLVDLFKQRSQKINEVMKMKDSNINNATHQSATVSEITLEKISMIPHSSVVDNQNTKQNVHLDEYTAEEKFHMLQSYITDIPNRNIDGQLNELTSGTIVIPVPSSSVATSLNTNSIAQLKVFSGKGIMDTLKPDPDGDSNAVSISEVKKLSEMSSPTHADLGDQPLVYLDVVEEDLHMQ